MSNTITGFRAPDAEWKKMKEVWDTCTSANVPVPEVVSEFFQWETPDETGIEVVLEGHDCCSEYNEEMRDGFQIDISKIPKGLTHVRFVHGY